jgi:TPP-dependent pyruvate/acetoin dehydrogenase alpha subunit
MDFRVRYNKLMNINYRLYERMLLIRKFEEKLLNDFSTGKLFGTTHAYIGQEANAVGIFDVSKANDIVFSNHRCHGHYLAYGGDPYLLVAEVMGKETGLVGGRGGSQHIQWNNFYSNGIQGGIAPIASGMALAEKILHTDRIALVFLGDGTLGQGVVYESLNLAALWNIPILFVVENNRYAQTTPIHKALAGTIQDRFKAFGIKSWESDSTDVLTIREIAEQAIISVRNNSHPGGLILHTYRFSAHSKGDDFRDADEIESMKEKDPLILHGIRLSDSERERAGTEMTRLVQEAFSRAEKDPLPNIENLAKLIS